MVMILKGGPALCASATMKQIRRDPSFDAKLAELYVIDCLAIFLVLMDFRRTAFGTFIRRRPRYYFIWAWFDPFRLSGIFCDSS